jgi:hypothetical protein
VRFVDVFLKEKRIKVSALADATYLTNQSTASIIGRR